MSSTKPLASILVLAFGVNLSICKPVWSQEQRSTVDDTLDDVVELPEVTVFGAARDGRDLLDTSSAVTVIDGAEMDRLQPSAHGGLMGDTPGVVIQGGRGVAQEPNIRGFQDEQVVVRVDGARQNFDLQHRGRFFVDPIMLKQVEVLRGGASTMFGSGALGGVISLDTKDASDILQEKTRGDLIPLTSRLLVLRSPIFPTFTLVGCPSHLPMDWNSSRMTTKPPATAKTALSHQLPSAPSMLALPRLTLWFTRKLP